MIKSLRKKFILINMLLIFLVLATVFTAIVVSDCRSAVRDSRMTLQMVSGRRDGQMQPLFEVGKNAPENFARAPVFLVLCSGDDVLRLITTENISITDEELTIIVGSVLKSGETEGVLSEYKLRWLKTEDRGETRIAFIERSGETAAIRRTVITSSLSLIGALLAFSVISFFLARWTLRPVEKAWEQQKRFVADASHELKTPLTVILANTGILLENRGDTVENQLRWIENTATEATRMQKLVGNLLYLAKTDDAKTPFVPLRLCFSDIVYSTALAFESLAYEKGIEIVTDDLAPDVYVDGDGGALSQLVAILLENAVKFSEGRSVTISLRVQQSKAVLSVNNRGAPLSADAQSQIFDRFYRADTARASEGYGLGLSIAKSIAETHHGKISVESSEQDGTTFTVKLGISAA